MPFSLLASDQLFINGETLKNKAEINEASCSLHTQAASNVWKL